MAARSQLKQNPVYVATIAEFDRLGPIIASRIAEVMDHMTDGLDLLLNDNATTKVSFLQTSYHLLDEVPTTINGSKYLQRGMDQAPVMIRIMNSK